MQLGECLPLGFYLVPVWGQDSFSKVRLTTVFGSGCKAEHNLKHTHQSDTSVW